MSRNEIILGASPSSWSSSAWSSSLVVPRRNPDFPGNRVGLFTLVAVLLVAAMLGTVELFGAEDEEGGAEAAAEAEGGGRGRPAARKAAEARTVAEGAPRGTAAAG